MKIWSIYIAIIISSVQIYGQPIMSSEKLMNGYLTYKDLKEPNRFYYAPGKLFLHQKEDDSPNFKLIEMRYTGTLATGNQGEVRFMNIVQFKVKMHQPDKTEILELKKHFPRGSYLLPVPLKNVEAYLVAPFEGTLKRIGKNGSFQSEGKQGNNTKTSFWSERVFTVRLENHEAQLLWNMVEEGQIGISVSYAYYADIVHDDIADVEATGNNGLDDIMDEVTTVIGNKDSVPHLTLIHADLFKLNIDINKYPEVLVKKDLNEGIPPSYPALQVMCFDFANDLRPDLAMKTIEFQATGVSGRPVKLRPEKFLNANSDLHTRQIRFPYAINMRKPLRYKVKEYSIQGDKIDGGWITRDSWIGIMDITSQQEDIVLVRKEIDLETDLIQMSEMGISKVIVRLEFTLKGSLKAEDIVFHQDDTIPLKQIIILCDKESNISYKIQKYSNEGKSIGLSKLVSIDNYVYVEL